MDNLNINERMRRLFHEPNINQNLIKPKRSYWFENYCGNVETIWTTIDIVLKEKVLTAVIPYLYSKGCLKEC